MTNIENDTIVAVATPPGRGGVGIVRLSGPDVEQIAFNLMAKLPIPRQATMTDFCDEDGAALDSGLALYFKAPASFTGEDVLELHGHGGPVPMDLLVSQCCRLGARLAQAGEFSKRAFLNDKIDLTQAEAISDLIDSASEQAARAAVRSLSGEFAKRIQELLKHLTELRMYVEAAIDFPEEEIDFLQDAELTQRVDKVESLVTALSADATQGQLLRDGMNLVITGQPNVGKSSLLNRLAGYDAAIVTAVPGTTRDVLREDIHIDGMPLHIVDTAGLHDSDDPVEIEGMRRARIAIAEADHVLHIVDAREINNADETLPDDASDFSSLVPEGVTVTKIANKIDLTDYQSGLQQVDQQSVLFVSAKSDVGIGELRKYLRESMGFSAVDGGNIIARRRHLIALDHASQHIHLGVRALLEQHAGEIMAEELRLAQQRLSEITGRFTSDDLLGEIFSSFCIGK